MTYVGEEGTLVIMHGKVWLAITEAILSLITQTEALPMLEELFSELSRQGENHAQDDAAKLESWLQADFALPIPTVVECRHGCITS